MKRLLRLCGFAIVAASIYSLSSWAFVRLLGIQLTEMIAMCALPNRDGCPDSGAVDRLSYLFLAGELAAALLFLCFALKVRLKLKPVAQAMRGAGR